MSPYLSSADVTLILLFPKNQKLAVLKRGLFMCLYIVLVNIYVNMQICKIYSWSPSWRIFLLKLKRFLMMWTYLYYKDVTITLDTEALKGKSCVYPNSGLAFIPCFILK